MGKDEVKIDAGMDANSIPYFGILANEARPIMQKRFEELPLPEYIGMNLGEAINLARLRGFLIRVHNGGFYNMDFCFIRINLWSVEKRVVRAELF